MSRIPGDTDFEYDLAVRTGNSRRLKTLVMHKVKPPGGMMLFALIRRHPELLNLLREAGANPNDLDGFNETALGRAIASYGVDVVKELLKLGADPNQESSHLLPLVWAASDEKIEYAKVLLAHGADPNRVQWNGVAPLWAAIRNGHTQAAKLLWEAGADPTLKGPDGNDPVELARVLKHDDIAQLLKTSCKSRSKCSEKTAGKFRIPK